MDAAQWKLEANNNTNNYISSNQVVQEKKVVRPQEEVVNCPRCKSTNTKFCYYNNYSLTQPRYFCKSCRRYWTQGGSLRNVPVGGGSRKNKRSISSSSSSSIPKPIDLSTFSSQNFTNQKGQDLNLGFQTTQQEYHNNGFSQFLKLPKTENNNTNHLNFLSSSSSSASASSTLTSVSGQDLVSNGTISGGLNTFMFNKSGGFMGFPFHENGGGFPFGFGVMNQQLASTRDGDQNMGHGDSTGYWN